MSSPISDSGFSAVATDTQSTQKSGATGSQAPQRLSAADMASNDTFVSQNQSKETPKKKNNMVLWGLGGLAAGIGLLALIKNKDGEPLLKAIFKRGGNKNDLPTEAPTSRTRHSDEDMVDPSMPHDANEMVSGQLDDLRRMGRRWRDVWATRRNLKKQGATQFRFDQLDAGNKQAAAIRNYNMVDSHYNKALRKYEKAVTNNDGSTKAEAKLRQATEDLRNATIYQEHAHKELVNANRKAARHGL